MIGAGGNDVGNSFKSTIYISRVLASISVLYLGLILTHGSTERLKWYLGKLMAHHHADLEQLYQSFRCTVHNSACIYVKVKCNTSLEIYFTKDFKNI